jgi:hypothetical protein
MVPLSYPASDSGEREVIAFSFRERMISTGDRCWQHERDAAGPAMERAEVNRGGRDSVRPAAIGHSSVLQCS